MSRDDGLIDPNETNTMNTRRSCRDGRKVFRAVGVTRDETKNGTPKVDFRVVCLKDLEKPYKGEDPETDVGLTARLTFFGSKAAFGRIGNFAKNIAGRREPFSFDPRVKMTPVIGDDGKPVKGEDGEVEMEEREVDEIAEEIVFGRTFVGEVKTSRDGKYADVEDWRPYKGELPIPGEEEVLDKAFDDWDEFLRIKAERESRPRRGGGGGRGNASEDW